MSPSPDQPLQLVTSVSLEADQLLLLVTSASLEVDQPLLLLVTTSVSPEADQPALLLAGTELLHRVYLDKLMACDKCSKELLALSELMLQRADKVICSGIVKYL